MSYTLGGLTLANGPSYPLDPDGDIEDNILRTPTDAGYRHTRPKFTRARRSWGLRFPDMSSSDAAALRTYEITTLRNGADSFTFTHPITGSFTVQLAGPIKFTRPDAGGNVNVSMTLQEV